MTTRNRLIGVVLSAAVVAVIGWIDYKTGPDVGLSLLYLIPIAASAWYGGVAAAVITGSFAGACWLAADLAWRDNDTAIAISVWNSFTRLVIYVSEGGFIALLRRDREKLKRLAARESLLARTDANTGLPNARAFIERAERELHRGEPLCVLYVDLDNFKTFNDRLGHAAGDDILEEVAGILKDSLGERDLAARIGGDEFAILLCCDADGQRAQQIADAVTQRIRAIAGAYGDVAFGATIGVACFNVAPDNAEDLLRAADDAMYRGKAMGKGRVVIQNV